MNTIKNTKLTPRQLQALEEVLDYVRLMREEVKQYGDEECDLTDSRMGLCSAAEDLFLTFNKERKKYL